MSANLATLDPLLDDRWDGFLRRRPDASVFHSRAWLRALQRTYGYQPLVITDSPPGEPLRNALLFCRVSSAITGKRLVPAFSDHCDPLVESASALTRLASLAADLALREGCRYTELRPRTAVLEPPFFPAATYYLHQLDLTSGAKAVYAGLHRDCIRRKIRRAEREELELRQGNSGELLTDFYRLHVRARSRLGLPPQPLTWFQALLGEFGDSGSVRVAYHAARPVAAIFTLEFQKTTVYKYGASDERFNKFGAAQALMWSAIEDACRRGHSSFDMGRTDIGQTGLIEYKDRWGARKTLLTYYRAPQSAARSRRAPSRTGLARRLFSKMPPPLAVWIGRLLYRHLA